jgi:hypothetical protein
VETIATCKGGDKSGPEGNSDDDDDDDDAAADDDADEKEEDAEDDDDDEEEAAGDWYNSRRLSFNSLWARSKDCLKSSAPYTESTTPEG